MKVAVILALALGTLLVGAGSSALDADEIEQGKKILKCRARCKKAVIKKLTICAKEKAKCLAGCKSRQDASACARACREITDKCAEPLIEQYVFTCRKACLGDSLDDSQEGMDGVQGVIVTRPD